MTKDEIIDGLKMTMDLCVFDPSTGEEIEPHLLNDINRATYDACKGALEILERLSTNLASLGTDCISRQAAIDALGEEPLVWYDGEDEIAERNQWKRDIEAIEQLPPIQPKRGRWIKSGRWGRVYYCNQCRNYLDFDGVNAGRGSTNFCPNCGAKMEVNNEIG